MRDRAVLTTAMSSMSIIVAADTTASVHRCVLVMPRASRTRAPAAAERAGVRRYGSRLRAGAAASPGPAWEDGAHEHPDRDTASRPAVRRALRPRPQGPRVRHAGAHGRARQGAADR